MKLLLDEHFSQTIAEQLRRQGHDVVAVAERPELQSHADAELLAVATHEQRVLVTNNVEDFVHIARAWAGEGRTHGGLLFTSDRSLPRTRAAFGALIAALTATLVDNEAEDALRDQVRWLSPAPGDG